MEVDFLPYKAEYAKSNTSMCKGCNKKIAKETLRLAEIVQAFSCDKRFPKWYHYECFFQIHKPKAVGDIESFECLKWDDQQIVRKKVADLAGDLNSKGGSKMATKSGPGGLETSVFKCDLANSNESICRECSKTIFKGELQVSKMDNETAEGQPHGRVPLWYHLDCFVKLRADLEFWADADALEGFSDLDKESREKMSAALPKMKQDEVDEHPVAKKTKEMPEDDKEVKALKKQIYDLTKYAIFLKSFQPRQIKLIMEENVEPVRGQSNNIERISDAMAFGWPKDCKKCGIGSLKYDSSTRAYSCLGYLDAWVKCTNVVQCPVRRSFMVPDDFEEAFRELDYEPKTGQRIIQVEERSVVLNTGPSTSSSEIKMEIEQVQPLKNMEFVILGKTETPENELVKEIKKLGGKVTTVIHKRLVAVISTKEEVEKMGMQMEKVKEANIQVVPEGFLKESLSEAVDKCITRLNMANWGSDREDEVLPTVMIDDALIENADSAKFLGMLLDRGLTWEHHYNMICTKAKQRLEEIESEAKILEKFSYRFMKTSKVTMKVKNGSAVDPDSCLQDVGHVYVEGNDTYSATLNLTNMARKQNKYYRIQILQAEGTDSYCVFRKWGRTGTDIGGQKHNVLELEKAICLFEKMYYEKTGNRWKDRNNFFKVPGRMVPLDVDLGTDQADNIRLTSDVECQLPGPVLDLINMLFCVNTMKNVMLEFELDLEKMPLGRISKRQIVEALSLLTNLQNANEAALASKDKEYIVQHTTNKFYTLIPHDCGTSQPPLLDNAEIIKSKVEMLQSLLEMEITMKVINDGNKENKAENALHPLEVYYRKLNTDIEPLPRDSEEFYLLEKYVKNTHAETHAQYTLVIDEIYKVKRQGEEMRFRQFSELHNRKLLWHGSRLTNFAGILSKGLRIAPPEAPPSGYMFGKGVYFADMVSKAANYCMTSPSKNTGLMLLCEVALGDMYECTEAEYVTCLPSGKNSCKGVGATFPDPRDTHFTDDGVEVPIGKPITGLQPNQTSTTSYPCSLLYNEFIVYDVAQIKTKYLFKMKFHYEC